MTYRIPAIVLVTGTTFEPVSLQELKTWLKVDEDDVTEDPTIATLNTAARQRIESETRRAMLKQTFDQVLEDVPCKDTLDLERSPLVSITSVRTFNTSDVTDTGGTLMSSTQYYADTANEPGRVVVLSGTWPTATRIANAAIVRFVAGYSSQSSGVPEALKLATKELATFWYENRGDRQAAALAADVRARPIPTHVQVILEDFTLPEWG